MKTVRPSRATVPISGHRPTSLLETKQAGSTPPSTGMSSQELWFDTNSTGRPPMDGACAPITRTRIPKARQTSAQ
jgi:hypothetical protein